MPGPLFLEGDIVTLHPVEQADLEFLGTCVNHPSVREFVAAHRPKTSKDERQWLETVAESDDEVLLVCADGDPVGNVGLHDVDTAFGTAELGYYVHPDAWSNGYATDAVGQVVGYAFAELRLHKVSARCFEHNDGSRRVLEKNGFQREGVLREEAFVDDEHVDMYRYGLLAEEWRASR